MKIILLHGDDAQKSYQRLSQFIDIAKKRSWEIVRLDTLNFAIEESLSGTSLFGNQRFFIIQGLKSLTKRVLLWINKNYQNVPGNLIIYIDGIAPQSVVKGLPKDTKVEEFGLPKTLWEFLDNLRPGNSQNTIRLFHKVIKTEAPELIFTLIARLFRDLYWAKVDFASLEYPGWRIGKLKKQTQQFNRQQLEEIIEALAKIDLEIKTGKAELVSALDLLFIKHLE